MKLKTVLKIIGGSLMLFGFILLISESEFKTTRDVLIFIGVKVIGFITVYSGYQFFKTKK
jgi:hypothetical protein